MNDERVDTLLGFAKLLNIEVSSEASFSKSKLCALLSESFFGLVTSPECKEGDNFTGDPLNAIPKWRIFTIENNCFDILDLKKLIDSNSVNPYTRKPLPVDQINTRIEQINAMSKQNLFDTTPLETLLEKVVYTEAGELGQLTRQLFADFEYLSDTSIVTNASDSDIDEMISKLVNTLANTLLLIPTGSIRAISEKSGVQKKLLFCKTLLACLIGTNREGKILLLESAFKSFLRKRRRDSNNEGEDLFEMMI